MSKFEPSIQERIDRIIEEVGMTAGAMTVGSDGFQGSASADGPVAGYDPLMGNKPIDRFLRKRRNKKGKKK